MWLYGNKNQYCGDTLWPNPSITHTRLSKHGQISQYLLHLQEDLAFWSDLLHPLHLLPLEAVLQNISLVHITLHIHKYFHDSFEPIRTVTSSSILHHIAGNYREELFFQDQTLKQNSKRVYKKRKQNNTKIYFFFKGQSTNPWDMKRMLTPSKN